MDFRSIDFAKTASIDMMALNNKVVNMRQVVKRTRVHVISKLCKHITALKKKKGTDEQKAKNLRKAQRLIEEIDSIKKLKEDKVSKYALANTTQFSDISKMSLSPGPRALARLADHPLMKKVVTDFREQHSDWRDLAAYLLIKQTGRRFKTKKQKQKKLAKCVENINAAETMTKAYIQERFGQEGVTKAEERFERKRKRQKSAVKLDSRENIDIVGEDSNVQKTASIDPEDSRMEDLVDEQETQDEKQIPIKDRDLLKNNEETLEQVKKKGKVIKMEDETVVEHKFTKGEKSKSEASSDENEENGAEVERENQTSNFKKSKSLPKHVDTDESSSSENSDNENTENLDVLDNDTEVVSDKHLSDLDQNIRTDKEKSKQKNECVVKELRLGETDDESSNIDDSVDDTNSDNEDNMIEDLGSNSDDDDQLGNVKHDGRKRKDKKKKHIPEFLTKANKTPVSDPFFAGSDDEGEDDFGDNMIHEIQNNDYLSDDDSSKFKAKSMFYNPDSRSSSQWSQRGRGRRGGFERRGAFGKFDNGQRGRTFRGDGRGRGQSLYGTGKEGNIRGLDKKSTVRQNYNQTTKDRFGGKKITEQEKSPEIRKGFAKDKTSHEKLHPSWEASKKRKAEQSGLPAFAGSKITFDDDD